MSETDDTSVFDMAAEAQSEVSEQLADDGGVDTMTLEGPTGRFTYIARGAALENQYRPALMEAISRTLDEHVFVDEADNPEAVQAELEPQLREVFDPMTAEHLAAQTGEKLADWSDYHGSGGDL